MPEIKKIVYICEIRYIYNISSATILNQMHNKESYLRQPAQKSLRIDSSVPNIV